MQSSMWPEVCNHVFTQLIAPQVEKVYGHGNELYALACNPSGSLVASSCRGAKRAECAVHLTSTATWRRVGSS